MTALLQLGTGPARDEKVRLSLLAGQSFSLGVTLALLIVTASALFLTAFGSEGLPYVYIAVAILGSLVFYGFAELQKSLTLPQLSISTLLLLALFFLLSWLGLVMSGSRWISFALMVAFSLVIQMGFVILGSEAGRLFDVRQVKRLFPRIVAGFAIGFLVGGFIAPPLASLLGKTENLLLAALVATLSFLAFFLVTNNHYHAELVQAQVGPARQRQPASSLARLLVKPFVLLIVLYQMLSAMVSQLLDFMVLDQAAERFTDSQALTQFFGNYTVVINLTDIIFLALFAGLLLSRYGLNFGLATNPVVDGIILLVQIVAGILLGTSSVLFFGLVMMARIIDITLTDGTTRGSINTAYQALPANERVAVQTGVEGIGVPVALGLTGVVLLVFNAIGGLSVLHIGGFTLIIIVFWTVSAGRMYRHYASSLIETLRKRALDRTELALDDKSSLAVLDELVHSSKPRVVNLALELLEDADQDLFDERLLELAGHPDPAIRTEALSRIERRRLAAALTLVEGLMQSETESQVKAAAIRAYCALKEADCLDRVLPYLEDEASQVRLGAAVGLLRYGGIPGVLATGERLREHQVSVDPGERLFVARVIGEVSAQHYFQPLMSLLLDADDKVRWAALVAAGRVRHPRLLPMVIDNLAYPASRSAAVAALVAYGEAVLPFAENALADGESPVGVHVNRLVRLCGQIGGERTIALLKAHIDQPDREVRHNVLAALSLSGYRAGPGEIESINDYLKQETAFGGQLLVAGQDAGDGEAVSSLQNALGDELAQVRQRVFLLLSFIYEGAAILRAGERLDAGDSVQQAMALEMLDVTLTSRQKKILFPLIDPKLSPARRGEQLVEMFAIPSLEREDRLLELIADADGSWGSDWIRACAIYAAGGLNASGCAGAVEACLDSPDRVVRETAAWSLHILDLARYQLHAAKLAADSDEQVARLAAELSADGSVTAPG